MTIQWRIWLSFSTTFILLIVIMLIGNYETKRVNLAEKWVTHTHEVLAKLEAVTSDLKDAETGQRGYLLVSEETYLAPYSSALKNIPTRLQELDTLVTDNPRQKRKIAQIRALVDGKLAELNETILLHRSGRTDEALSIVRTRRGHQLMDDIRAVTNEMRTDENALLEHRKIESNRVTNSSKWIIYGCSIFTIFVAALVAFLTSRSITKDYAQLQSTKKSLATANQELQNFVYRTSHDFKSPVLGIKSMTNFIEEDLRSGDIDEALENINRVRKNAESLEKVVNSTLQLAKTDLSDTQVESVHLEELIMDVHKRLEGFAKEHEVELMIGSVIHTGSISTDRNHLVTILENLISNGIKYSDKKTDKSFVNINAALDISGSVDITIDDNGVGIPTKRQTEVFGMFKQFHPDRSNGTGLGMYIVKKSVERLSGVISFDSSSKGTRFHITIPNLSSDSNTAEPG